jgi:serine/threonine-protein kinase
MAEIYLARVAGAEGFSKLVVVKRLLDKLAGDPEFVQMFLDEARINARLSHANIVQVLELGEVDGQYFMAMEYISGLSVAQVGRLATQRMGEVPQGVACGIVAQACAGLHRAHETKLPDGSNMAIIHRDVSPQNLLLTYEGYVKVVDFGIAKAEGRATQTRAGLVKGKFAYMSPEQCLGEDLDRRTDIFALGIVLFELCTSRRLFKRNSTYETYDAIVRCDVPAPSAVSPSVPKQIEAVIQKALARRREDRFPTAEAMQEALEVAMRRTGLRGSPLDLSRFLEQNFAQEIREQEALLRRVESGELAQAEHQQEVENSQIAKNFADADEDGGGAATMIQDRTESLDRNQAAPPPPPPPVPGALRISPPTSLPQEGLEMIPHRPMSMAMPIISGKEDEPALRAVDRERRTPSPGPAPAPPASRHLTPEPMPAPPAPVSLTPPGPQPGPLSMGSPPPGAPEPPRQAKTPQPMQAPPPPAFNLPMGLGTGALAAQQTPAPVGALIRLANLPMPYLIGIGVALAILSALITSLLL